MWILGLKPSVGGALKPGRAVEGPSTVSMIVYFSVNDYIVFSIIICKTYFCLFFKVLTTAVMTDLPSISSMISKLFENSQ